MKKLLTAIRLVGEIFTMKHEPEFKSGKGPYSCINEEDGTSWNMYYGFNGVNYTYGALQPY